MYVLLLYFQGIALFTALPSTMTHSMYTHELTINKIKEGMGTLEGDNKGEKKLSLHFTVRNFYM